MQWHINCLEDLAAFHAVKCFVRDKKKSITVLLRMDNTTAVTYVNKLGGTVSPKLNTIVRELWLWCMNRHISYSGGGAFTGSPHAIQLRTKNPR